MADPSTGCSGWTGCHGLASVPCCRGWPEGAGRRCGSASGLPVTPDVCDAPRGSVDPRKLYQRLFERMDADQAHGPIDVSANRKEDYEDAPF